MSLLRYAVVPAGREKPESSQDFLDSDFRRNDIYDSLPLLSSLVKLKYEAND
jgi:hypothetical protein